MFRHVPHMEFDYPMDMITSDSVWRMPRDDQSLLPTPRSALRRIQALERQDS